MITIVIEDLVHRPVLQFLLLQMHCMLIAVIKTAIAIARLNTTFVSSFSAAFFVKGSMAGTVSIMETTLMVPY